MAKTIAALAVKISVITNEFKKGTAQVEKGMKGIAKKAKNLNTALVSAFGASSVISAVKSVSHASMEFESELAKLNQTAKLSSSALKDVGNETQSLAAKFGVSSNEIVHGLGTLNRLGYKTADSLKAMPEILKFSIATNSDFEKSISLLETTMQDFHIPLQKAVKFTDVFTKTQATSLTTTYDLREAFKKAGASAHTANASVEDLSAAVGILSKKSFTGSVAGQAMNAIFANLAKSGGTAQESLQELGVEVLDAAGNMRPFKEIITDIQGAMQDLNVTGAKKVEFAQIIAGKEHMAKFLALINGSLGSFEDYSNSLKDSAGTTNQFFSEVNKTTKQSLARMEAAFESFKQKMGDLLAPAIGAVADAIAKLLGWFNNLDPSVQKIVAIVGIAVGIFVTLTAVISALVVVIGILEAELLIPIALIALFIAALVALWMYSDEIVNFLKSSWGSIGSFFSSLWEGIKASMSAFGSWLVETWNSLVEAVITAFQWLYKHNYYFQYWVDTVMFILNTAKTFWTTVWNFLVNHAVNKMNNFKNATIAIWNAVVNYLTGKWNLLKNIAISVFNAISSLVSAVGKSIPSEVKRWASQAFQWGSNLIDMLVAGIKRKISSVISVVKSIGSTVAKYLGFHSPTEKGPLADSDTWMPNFMNMLSHGMEMGIPKLRMAVGDVAMSIADGAGGSSTSVTNNVNVYPRQANLDARGLNRELERMRYLNGGMF